MQRGSSQRTPDVRQRLLRVPLAALYAHPSNSNVMSEERLEKLARNIAREGRYPPLIARPHPDRPGEYELLDGHQRAEALRRLGYSEVQIVSWDCDDAAALLLLASLNRLRGEDDLEKRSALLAELTGAVSTTELADLVPDDVGSIDEMLARVADGSDAVMRKLRAAIETARISRRVISFGVEPEEQELIEAALDAAVARRGRARRGSTLASICRRYLESDDG